MLNKNIKLYQQTKIHYQKKCYVITKYFVFTNLFTYDVFAMKVKACKEIEVTTPKTVNSQFYFKTMGTVYLYIFLLKMTT